jgi:hypothetical protein
VAQLTAHEQLMLELVNRARLDPGAEAKRHGIDLNQGLTAGTISTAAKQPLAGNDFLVKAARDHSKWMLDADTFSHTGAGGSSPGDRMAAAGYKFAGSWTWGENIAYSGTTGTLNVTQTVLNQHGGLFKSAGHRKNMLNDNFREVGIGVETGEYKGYNALMTTENFAKSGTALFLTGVAYADGDGDRFYDVGEGRSGVTVKAQPASGAAASTTTAGAGGFEKALAAGTYEVTFSGGGLAKPLTQTLSIADRNVKLDVVGADSIACSTGVALGQNVKGATLLGTGAFSLDGNGLANVLTGNVGDNAICGGGGADAMRGGGGNDTFVLRAGEVQGDLIVDFDGAGSAVGDFLRFEGYGSQAKLTSLGSGKWQVSDGSRTETFNASDSLHGSDYGFFASVAPPPAPEPEPTPEPTPSGDPVTGTAGPDRLHGSSGADVMGGGGGDDSLYGYGGDDKLYGGDGADYISASAGNDVLVGGAGADSLFGGGGSDLFVFRSLAEAGDAIFDFSKSAGDRIDARELFDALGYGGSNPFADGYARTAQAGSAARVEIDPNGGGDGFQLLATLANNSAASLGQDYLLWA